MSDESIMFSGLTAQDARELMKKRIEKMRQQAALRVQTVVLPAVCRKIELQASKGGDFILIRCGEGSDWGINEHEFWELKPALQALGYSCECYKLPVLELTVSWALRR